MDTRARILSEHVRDSNGFVHVSPAEVVWRSENVAGLQGMRRLDVETGTSSLVWDQYDPNSGPMPSDVHDTTRITPLLGHGQVDPPISLLIEAAGQEQLRLDSDTHGVEPGAMLSPDGSFALAAAHPHSDGAAIVDIRDGTIWKPPLPHSLTDSYGWLAWSYGNLAVVKFDEDDKTEIDPDRLRRGHPGVRSVAAPGQGPAAGVVNDRVESTAGRCTQPHWRLHR